MESYIGKYFSEVSDPRSSRNQRHSFSMLIGTSLLAMLSGVDSFSGIQDYVACHESRLCDYFDLSHGVPSHDTYQRLWDGIRPDEFLSAFHLFTETLASLSSEVISIDGKRVRNSGDDPFYAVSAWCQANQLVLAQHKVSSNEIVAIPELLSLLDLTDKIITIDAIGAQRNICEQIVAQGGDYVIALKRNQKSLLEDVECYLAAAHDDDCINEEHDKGHGRIEHRIATANDQIEWLQETHQWPGLRSIGKVESKRTRMKTGKESQETRYYLSSLPAHAGRLNEIARSHWSIENQLHWRLDVVLNEDKACIRNDNAVENMDILRKWALNIAGKVKEKQSQSIKSVMRKNAMSFDYLIKNMAKVFHA